MNSVRRFYFLKTIELFSILAHSDVYTTDKIDAKVKFSGFYWCLAPIFNSYVMINYEENFNSSWVVLFQEYRSLYVFIKKFCAVVSLKFLCTQLYDIKYSNLIQIICTQFFDIKYSYLIQIICTQFYDIKYSYLIQIVYTIVWYQIFLSNINN